MPRVTLPLIGRAPHQHRDLRSLRAGIAAGTGGRGRPQPHPVRQPVHRHRRQQLAQPGRRRRRRQHLPGCRSCRSAWCSSARTPRPRPRPGYRYSDTSIEDFSLTHFDGAGCPNNEDLDLLPVTGAVGTSPGTGWTSYASGYTKANESAAAGYYRTGSTSTAHDRRADRDHAHRRGAADLPRVPPRAQVLINASRSATGSRSGSVSVNGATVTGNVHRGRVLRLVEDLPDLLRDPVRPRPDAASAPGPAATVSAGSGSRQRHQHRRLRHLRHHRQRDRAGDGRAVLRQRRQRAGQPRAPRSATPSTPSGPTRTPPGTRCSTGSRSPAAATADLQKFYTALYHVFTSPNIASDVNGQYRGFDNAVHTASGMTVYQNYSGWDIYRSWAALVALDRARRDDRHRQVDGARRPAGRPAAQVVAADRRGLRDDRRPRPDHRRLGVRVRRAQLRHRRGAVADGEVQSNGGTTQGSPIRGRESGYLSRHYIVEDPSDSLEYSASDFAVAQFAQALGDTTTYNTYMTRAQWWRNTFNTESAYIHPHNSDGTWTWPLDPASPTGYTEGNAAQYTWMVTVQLRPA